MSARIGHRAAGARRAAHAGYTLLEALIVLAILGVMTSLMVVNFERNEAQALEHEAQRLAALLRAARDEAVLSGHALAWRAHTGGHTFLRRDGDSAWRPLEPGTPYGARAWPEPVALTRFQLNGMPGVSGAPLVFSSSGVNPPFELELASGGWRVALHADFSGAIRVLPLQPPESAR